MRDADFEPMTAFERRLAVDLQALSEPALRTSSPAFVVHAAIGTARRGAPSRSLPMLTTRRAIVLLVLLALSAMLVGIAISGRPRTPLQELTAVASVPPRPSATPKRSPRPSVAGVPAGVGDLVNRFLDARIAGVGAERYLTLGNATSNFAPPLLYATTSGAPYERAEFEPMPRTDDSSAGEALYKVRLFAGGSVVE